MFGATPSKPFGQSFGFSKLATAPALGAADGGGSSGGIGAFGAQPQPSAQMQSSRGLFAAPVENQIVNHQVAGVNQFQCLTAMPRFLGVSLEEIRSQDYNVRQVTGGSSGQQPAAQPLSALGERIIEVQVGSLMSMLPRVVRAAVAVDLTALLRQV